MVFVDLALVTAVLLLWSRLRGLRGLAVDEPDLRQPRRA